MSEESRMISVRAPHGRVTHERLGFMAFAAATARATAGSGATTRLARA